ncbi:MAG: J domain-containing protein [Spirulinaceae cyanobacterium RM2_2_10]|nr:J domain-containing protein [Spirulinaceae cyanobacterium SM2_1_0]NJO19982.1 J domain-containing protein [Spirulinaceae cyanobacterium RM2_2_10]
MDLAACYRLLELDPGADLAQVKTAYRRLARCYHPDVNPSDPAAQAQFVSLSEAYQTLMQASDLARRALQLAYATAAAETAPSPPPPPPPPDPQNYQIKLETYQRLQRLLQQARFARAIAVVEGLALRLPGDPEVRQWQAIAYQAWARQLWAQRRWDKAQLYFQKALRTDPHNRALHREVSQDLDRLTAEFSHERSASS